MGLLWVPGGNLFSGVGGGSGGSRLLQGAQVQVPVPRTPRTVIKFYDGNTVIT